MMLTLDQNGGAVTLELPRGGDLLLRHDGAEFPVRWMTWLEKAPVETGSAVDTITLASVEAGPYELCAGPRCKSGILTPNGSLRLSLD